MEGSRSIMEGQRKLLLKNFQSPGDILMLTAAVRDLHRNHPGRFLTDVDTSCGHLWENNPYITKLNRDDPSVEIINCEYPLIHKSNQAPYHFIHGFAQDLSQKLKVPIQLTEFKGDIHISQDEQSWMSQIQEMGVNKPYWVLVAGGKYDYTAKWWNPDYYQEVVDKLVGKVLFVQTGEKDHFHKPLKNVINLVGKTDLRQLVRLIYNSVGVLSGITFAMHAAAAIPVRAGMPENRACVVVAGAREPTQWEAYPNHRFLSNTGALPCCKQGGCWKSRCQLVGDGDKKDFEGLCEAPIQITNDLRIPKCMHMIKPDDVVKAVNTYYDGGILEYIDKI